MAVVHMAETKLSGWQKNSNLKPLRASRSSSSVVLVTQNKYNAEEEYGLTSPFRNIQLNCCAKELATSTMVFLLLS